MFNNENNFDFDQSVIGNNNVVDNDMNVDINMMQSNQMDSQPMATSCCNPIQEAVKERCIHRTIVHEVPHV